MKIELVLPDGDQCDLEMAFTEYMIADAIANPWFAFNNQWGESHILQGKKLHTIQWSYVGIEEEYDVDDNVIDTRWECGEPDFQIDCSWCENENYVVNMDNNDKDVTIKVSELERLQKLEALLWKVEAALPVGLESWINDDELETLRG